LNYHILCSSLSKIRSHGLARSASPIFNSPTAVRQNFLWKAGILSISKTLIGPTLPEAEGGGKIRGRRPNAEQGGSSKILSKLCGCKNNNKKVY